LKVTDIGLHRILVLLELKDYQNEKMGPYSCSATFSLITGSGGYNATKNHGVMAMNGFFSNTGKGNITFLSSFVLQMR